MTETLVHLDRLHTVSRDGDRWALRKQTPEGVKLLSAWRGPLRSLERKLEVHGIVPDRGADYVLQAMAEHTGFRDRSV